MRQSGAERRNSPVSPRAPTTPATGSRAPDCPPTDDDAHPARGTGAGGYAYSAAHGEGCPSSLFNNMLRLPSRRRVGAAHMSRRRRRPGWVSHRPPGWSPWHHPTGHTSCTGWRRATACTPLLHGVQHVACRAAMHAHAPPAGDILCAARVCCNPTKKFGGDSLMVWGCMSALGFSSAF